MIKPFSGPSLQLYQKGLHHTVNFRSVCYRYFIYGGQVTTYRIDVVYCKKTCSKY